METNTPPKVSTSSSSSSSAASSPSGSPAAGRKSPSDEDGKLPLATGGERSVSPVSEASNEAKELLGATAAVTSAMSNLSMAEIKKSVKANVSGFGMSKNEVKAALKQLVKLNNMLCAMSTSPAKQFLKELFKESGCFHQALVGLKKMSSPNSLCPLRLEAKQLLNEMKSLTLYLVNHTEIEDLIGEFFLDFTVQELDWILSKLFIYKDSAITFLAVAHNYYPPSEQSEATLESLLKFDFDW